MNTFEKIVTVAAEAPWWIPLIVCPALVLAAALVFALAGGRKAYPAVALFAAGAGFALLSARGDLTTACFYLGCMGALSALFALFLLIPRPRRGARRKGGSKAERMYEKFRIPLEAEGEVARPPKECCFAEAPAEHFTLEESGMRLTHAAALLEKLFACPLSAGDRLEAQALARRLDGYRGRLLTEAELSALNDCLASVLRLTAKYKL